MRIIELDTGLFPDRETTQAAVRVLEATHEVVRIDVKKPALGDAAWDKVVRSILNADRVIVL